MGRVFTGEKIHLKHVPETQRVTHFIAQFRKAAERMDGFRGGILCGSYASGTATARSDIDGILVFDDASFRDADRFMIAMRAEAAEIFAPIDMRAIPTSLARNGGHGISLSFGEHLHDAALYRNGEIGNNPMPLFAYRTRDRAHEAFEYVARKIGQFRHEMYGFQDLSLEDQAKFLQKMIEAPIHVARKILKLEGALPDDSRAMVVRTYRERADERALAPFNSLVSADEAYTEHLPAHLTRYDAVDYQAELGTLEIEIPNCIALLTFILDRLAQPKPAAE